MSKLAFVFPGQGSQAVGMMDQWGDHQNIVDGLFAQASDALSYDLQAVVREGPADKLNQTQITQPAMLVAGYAAYRVWQDLGQTKPEVVAGHSLGEYTALVCANSLDFTDAVKLVAQRGHLMQSAVPEGEGAMAAIIGLEDAAVIEACAQVAEGVVAAVNFNSPGQVVIAGNKSSVDSAMANAKDLGAKRALPLPVSVPSHCALMTNAADELFETLQAVQISDPEIPVVHNQNAATAGSADEIRNLLRLQLFQPVLWVDCVNRIKQMGVDTLVEMGPGKVLTGLSRRIDKTLGAKAVFDIESLNTTIETIGG